MNTLNSLISDLRAVNKKRGPRYVAEFEQVLEQIMSLGNADSILPLLEFLDDDSSFDELMFSIVHSIEVFNDKVYIAKILKGVSDLYERSPRWASIIFMRILNSENSRLELILQIRNYDQATKMTIRHLMEKINSRGMQFVAKTAPVIKAAS